MMDSIHIRLCFIFLVTVYFLGTTRALHATDQNHKHGDAKSAVSSPPQLLECFQVSNPVLTPHGLIANTRIVGEVPDRMMPSCTIQFPVHEFSNSHNRPFIINYIPPPECDFNRVVMSLTATSKGRQYDRLGIMYLGGREIWRTSTAQPKPDPGITWTQWKDLTTYVSLFRERQKFVFDLGNTVDDTFTGSYNISLRLTFVKHIVLRKQKAQPAPLIWPMTFEKSDGSVGAFAYPKDEPKKNFTLPRNTKRAVFTISATGQGGEEFWWHKVPSSVSDFYTVTHKPLPGLSSYREIRLLIDGQIAGLASPPPLTFTGGISPPLHRPIVGIQTFDLPEYEIDITPWLGLLCQGRSHTFSLEVWAVDDRGPRPRFVKVPMHWIMTGKLFMWLDGEDSVTLGKPPKITISELDYKATRELYIIGREGMVIHDDIPFIPLAKKPPRQPRDRVPVVITNPDTYLDYKQTISRTLQVKARIKTEEGRRRTVVWKQQISMENNGILTEFGYRRKIGGKYTVESRAEDEEVDIFYHGFTHSPQTDFTYRVPDKAMGFDLSVDSWFRHGFDQTLTGQTVFQTGLEPYSRKHDKHPSGTTLTTFIDSRAFFHQDNNGSRSVGYGTTRQDYKIGIKHWLYDQGISYHPDVALYMRDVTTVNETVMNDNEFSLERSEVPGQWLRINQDPAKVPAKPDQEFAPLPPKEPRPPGVRGQSQYPHPKDFVKSADDA